MPTLHTSQSISLSEAASALTEDRTHLFDNDEEKTWRWEAYWTQAWSSGEVSEFRSPNWIATNWNDNTGPFARLVKDIVNESA